MPRLRTGRAQAEVARLCPQTSQGETQSPEEGSSRRRLCADVETSDAQVPGRDLIIKQTNKQTSKQACTPSEDFQGNENLAQVLVLLPFCLPTERRTWNPCRAQALDLGEFLNPAGMVTFEDLAFGE